MIKIKNRKAYPQVMKAAVQRAGKAALRAKSTVTSSDIADDFNISKGTVCVWRRQAGVNAQQPAQLAAYQAARTAKMNNKQPKVMYKADGTIAGIGFDGMLYT